MKLDRQRWQYWSPMDTTRPWLPRIERGGDEYGNPSWIIVTPLLGAVVVFYGREFQRNELWCDECDRVTGDVTRGDEMFCVVCGTFRTYTEESLAG